MIVFEDLEFAVTFAIRESNSIRDVAQPGSAHVWGAWGRWFESSHPDKKELHFYFKWSSFILDKVERFERFKVGRFKTFKVGKFESFKVVMLKRFKVRSD